MSEDLEDQDYIAFNFGFYDLSKVERETSNTSEYIYNK